MIHLKVLVHTVPNIYINTDTQPVASPTTGGVAKNIGLFRSLI